MGWMILNIAFGIVALWLLGEVLLQFKARLRWRVLAFVGFLCVVAGVELGSVVIIGVGAVGFAIGQTQVTLSFRRGFTMGWALGGKAGESKRRRADPGRRPEAEQPRLEVSGLEYGPDHGAAYPPQGQDTAYLQIPDPAYSPGRDMPQEHQGQDTVYVRGLNGSFTQGPDGHLGMDPHRTPETAFEPAPPPPSAPPPFPPSGDFPRVHPSGDFPGAVPVYEPEPLPDDTGQYGVYGSDTGAAGYPPSSPADTAYASAGAPQAPGYGAEPPAGPGDWGYPPDPSGPATAADAWQEAPPQAGFDAYADHDQRQYGYDTGPQQYPGYPDDVPGGAPTHAFPGAGAPQAPGGYPHSEPAATSYAPGMDGVAAAGGQPHGAPQPGSYDPYGRPYGHQPQDPYDAYGQETPPGGVWMPQQRATEDRYDGELPPEQQYPYQGRPGGYEPRGHEHGYDEQQYRY